MCHIQCVFVDVSLDLCPDATIATADSVLVTDKLILSVSPPSIHPSAISVRRGEKNTLVHRSW
ncbi:MAG: hypothetical protein IKY44_04185, partial [Clostridia bacterium]|nr:hypothetical protein [Clostridia bacterium]